MKSVPLPVEPQPVDLGSGCVPSHGAEGGHERRTFESPIVITESPELVELARLYGF